MSKIKIIIVEDETLIAEGMKVSLEAKGYEVSAITDKGEEAVALITEHEADLAILDISLAGAIDGIQTAAIIRKETGIPFIFLSSLSDESTHRRAAETQPANYLLKPFTPDQMHISIVQAIVNHAKKKSPQPGELQEATDSDPFPVIRDSVFLKNKKEYFQKYKLSEILYLSADRTYCNIYMANQEEHVITSNLKDVLTQINDPSFMRVHRSYVVNTNRIDGFKGNTLIINQKEIPVNSESKEVLFKRLRIVK